MDEWMNAMGWDGIISGRYGPLQPGSFFANLRRGSLVVVG